VLGALRAPGQRLTRLKLAPTAIVAVWTILALCLPGPELWLERHLIGYADVYHLAVTAAIWLALAGDRGSIGRRFAPILIVSFGIFAGVRWPHGPWWVIRHLPLYADLRVPSRYLILAALPLTMWAGLGLDVLTARLSARHLRRLPGWLTTPRIGALALAAILVEGLAFSTPTWLGIFTVLYQTPTLKRPFHQEDGDIRWMFSGVLQNFGTLKCDEEAPLQRGDLDKGTVESGTEQARLDDPSAGSARQVDWTPNQVTVEVDLQRPTEVLVNQNWNEHWRSSDAEVIAVAGRLAFRGVPGKRTVVLRYRPRSFVVGAWVSAGAALLGLGLLALELRRRRR
jgi:hypothetical protein